MDGGRDNGVAAAAKGQLVICALLLSTFAAASLGAAGRAHADEAAATFDGSAERATSASPGSPGSSASATEARGPGSIVAGVFTAAQAQRGEAVYTGPCSRCHGYKLDGAPDDPDMFPTPPIAGAKFLRNWEGRSLAALFDYTRATMPADNPSYLSDQEYADLIAYMLAASGMPAGPEPLGTDRGVLARLVIGQQR